MIIFLCENMREHLFNQYLTRQACSMVSHHEIFWTVYVSPLGWCPPTKPAYAHTVCFSVHSGNLVFVFVCMWKRFCVVCLCVFMFVCLLICIYHTNLFVCQQINRVRSFSLYRWAPSDFRSTYLICFCWGRVGYSAQPGPDPPILLWTIPAVQPR